jgi:hypothetical protein
MDQVIQIVGALLILVPFAAAQFGRLRVTAPAYLVLNLVGSAILTGVALDAADWGFFLLEFVWALVSSFGLYQVMRGRPPAPAH